MRFREENLRGYQDEMRPVDLLVLIKRISDNSRIRARRDFTAKCLSVVINTHSIPELTPGFICPAPVVAATHLHQP